MSLVARAPSQALRVEPNLSTRLTSAEINTTAELSIPLRGLVATITSRSVGTANYLVVRHRLRLISSVQTETVVSSKPLAATAP
ncbi:MAG: hypothetical protein H0T79_16700 [Deltaproteobacteria bacterium]|nr:hypothetical protein [Deltaproteobacteria bacterium]